MSDGWPLDDEHDDRSRRRSSGQIAREGLDAVTAGLSLLFSSGPVEGNVNRMLKRQTYGQAGLDLLRKRVLLAH